jgi:hypothetical protein
MNRTPLYIFDLDGTLADLKHRRHFVEYPLIDCANCGHQHNTRKCRMCETKHPFEPDWDAFHAACVDDTPIQPVIELLNTLLTAGPYNDANDIWVFSGRSDAVEAQTLTWLAEHTWLDRGHHNWQLKMRPASDYTLDDQLKESWLHAMTPEDRARLVMTFDDRDRVVAMWRRNGVVCAQVAPGDF